MSEEVSTFRLYLMRLLYLGNFRVSRTHVWPELIKHEGAWDPVRGVAFSFWLRCRLCRVWDFDTR